LRNPCIHVHISTQWTQVIQEYVPCHSCSNYSAGATAHRVHARWISPLMDDAQPIFSALSASSWMPQTPTSSQCTTTPGASLSTTCSSASPLTPPHDQIALGPLDNIPHIISPPSNSSCTSSYNSLPELDPLTWLPALLPINSVRLSSALSPQPCTPRNFNPNTPIFSHMWKEFDPSSLGCACPGVFSEQQNLTRWCWVFGLVPMVLVWISGLEGRCG